MKNIEELLKLYDMVVERKDEELISAVRQLLLDAFECERHKYIPPFFIPVPITPPPIYPYEPAYCGGTGGTQ